jgi:hypothetical protein
MKNFINNSFLPVFNGFYGTIWGSEIDSQEEMEIDYYVTELDKNVEYEDFTIDYKSLFRDYSIDIAYDICKELKDLKVISEYKFEKLISPREYNFSNDSVNIEYTLTHENVNTIKTILEENNEEWSQYIKDKFTPCSGFSPFYSNDITHEDWDIDFILENNKTTLGFIFDFILEEVYGIDEVYIIDNIEFYIGEYMTLNEKEVA